MVQQYQFLDTMVVGAGLVGMATAAAYSASGNQLSVMVLEHGKPSSYRANTPSQGNLRGSRVVDQTMELTADIRRTWQHIDTLEATYETKIQGKTSVETPYLMVVKDEEHLRGMQQDLADKGSTFTTYSIADATRLFKINFPVGYAGVVNALESKTLDIDAYLLSLQTEIEAHGGEIRYQTFIKRYGKLRTGEHFVELSDGSSFTVKNLIVATGTQVSDTLGELEAMHAESVRGESARFAAPRRVPDRFRPESSILVPQRTIHVLFDNPAQHPKPTTVYNLDIDRIIKLGNGRLEKHLGNLGFYMFPDTLDDGTGHLVKGLKVGYDPMGRSLEDQEVLDQQEQLMLDHVSKTYGVPKDEIRIVSRHSCAYPLDSMHYPCMGQSKFHAIRIAANFIGYGAMAAYGAAEHMIANAIPADSRYNPDIEPNKTNLALFKTYYGDEKTFPPPPSADLEYGVQTD